MTEDKQSQESKMDVIHGELCPLCNNKSLSLIEEEREIPYFGNVYLFSMTCQTESCRFHKSDIELAEDKGPITLTFAVETEEDLKVRFVKSASATVKIPRILTIESTETSNGYISNIEGLLNRVKRVLEGVRDSAEDKDEAKKAKNHLKKIQRAMWGQEKLTITVEDPTGNSAIISPKTEIKQKKAKK